MPKKARSSATAATSLRQGREGDKATGVDGRKEVDAIANSGRAGGKEKRVCRHRGHVFLGVLSGEEVGSSHLAMQLMWTMWVQGRRTGRALTALSRAVRSSSSRQMQQSWMVVRSWGSVERRVLRNSSAIG